MELGRLELLIEKAREAGVGVAIVPVGDDRWRIDAIGNTNGRWLDTEAESIPVAVERALAFYYASRYEPV